MFCWKHNIKYAMNFNMETFLKNRGNRYFSDGLSIYNHLLGVDRFK